MTRRTLFIIIAVLAALDLATGVWYVAGHMNSDGKGDIFDRNEDSVTMADVINDKSENADKFGNIDEHAYFKSNKKSGSNYFCCIKRLKACMPTTVNGSNALSELTSELTAKAFGSKGDSNFEFQSSYWLKSPSFIGGKMDYQSVEQAPTIVTNYGSVYGIKIYPAYNTTNFLTMAIDKTYFNGQATTEQLCFVTYNRKTHHVMDKFEILKRSATESILNLINKKIDQLKGSKKQIYFHATAIPLEIYVRNGGIFFIFPEGEITSKSEGIVKVLVSYKELQPYLTPEFNEIVRTNSGFTDYNPVSFNK